MPLVLVKNGTPLQDRMDDKVRVEVDEVMEQARATQGLERDGSISIIPRS